MKLDEAAAHAPAGEIADLRRIVDERAALSGNARESPRRLTYALQARLSVEGHEAVRSVLDAVADCLAAPEQVADLLATRQHVARWRGNA